MNIELSSEDLRRMSPTQFANLLSLLQHERLKNSQPASQLSSKTNVQQLSLNVASSQLGQEPHTTSKSMTLMKAPTLTQQQMTNAHVRLSQLFAAGFTRAGMAVRVQLTQDLVKQRGHKYVTKGLAISPKGTVVYDGQEFDKPSPLAKQVNGSAINGWEYVEVMKDGQWVCLDELRKIWRKA